MYLVLSLANIYPQHGPYPLTELEIYLPPKSSCPFTATSVGLVISFKLITLPESRKL